MGRPAKPAKRPLPFRVKLSAADFHALVKHSRPQSQVSRRLVAAQDSHAKGAYVVSGYETDGLALRALAVAHAILHRS